MNILQRAYDKKVKIAIQTTGHSFADRYIMDIGDDYMVVTHSLKKKSYEKFIKLACIESIYTQWKE